MWVSVSNLYTVTSHNLVLTLEIAITLYLKYTYESNRIFRNTRDLRGLCSRHCAASRRVSGSIPGGVTGDFFSEATDRTMCPGVNSASKNEYQDTPGGKGGRCVRVTTLPPPLCRKSRKSGALTYRIPKGLLRPVAGKL